MDTQPFLPTFHLFSRLPTELRLKIWRTCLPARVVEVSIKQKSAPPDAQIEDYGGFPPPGSYRALTRPVLPIIFSVCRESRFEALSQYRPAKGAGFDSAYGFPWNLFNPAIDTLFFARSLYSLQAAETAMMWSPEASESLGMPREFVLDRLAQNPADVADMTSLSISWTDFHVKNVEVVAESLKPYKNLRELILTVFEWRSDRVLEKFMAGGNTPAVKKMQVALVEHTEGQIQGRFLQRMVDEHDALAQRLNDGLKVLDDIAIEEGRTCPKAPSVQLKLARFT